MSRHAPTPLSMSQTKEELLRHLNMSTEIYELMASETADVYAKLTKNPNNFKQPNQTPIPPFDWSDITELAKQNAARDLSQGTSPATFYYWQMGKTPTNDNNWIAIWFLYHKFRYRDGRNRAKDSKKGTKKHHKSASDGKKSSSKASSSHQDSVSSSSQSAPSAGRQNLCHNNLFNTTQSDILQWHIPNLRSNQTAIPQQKLVPAGHYTTPSGTCFPRDAE